jgi:hypothetical protein
MTFTVATYVYASSQGQRTHSARTKQILIMKLYSLANYPVLSYISLYPILFWMFVAYIKYFILAYIATLVTTVIKIPEGVVIGFPNFARAPK